MAALTAEAAHLADRHALRAGSFQRLLDVVDLERLDDRGDELHRDFSVTFLGGRQAIVACKLAG